MWASCFQTWAGSVSMHVFGRQPVRRGYRCGFEGKPPCPGGSPPEALPTPFLASAPLVWGRMQVSRVESIFGGTGPLPVSK